MSERSTRGSGGRWPMPDRSMVATMLGVPVWAAIGVAAGFTALGVCIDLLRIGSLGAVFAASHVVGCLLAAAWVRRDGLFWPVVQPPLLVAITVPLVVLLAGSPRPGTGIAERALVIGAPMVNAFPIMALATGLVLALGLFRRLTQRLRPADPPARKRRPVSSRRGPAGDEAPAAARKSRSPRPS